MASRDFVFTSESVSEGHPDKICDRISDAIVDTFLAAEPQARCGVETLVTTNRVVLAGEVRGPASITSERLIEVARRAIREIGYEQENFHWQRAAIECLIHGQSTDIAQGVDASGTTATDVQPARSFSRMSTERSATDSSMCITSCRSRRGGLGVRSPGQAASTPLTADRPLGPRAESPSARMELV